MMMMMLHVCVHLLMLDVLLQLRTFFLSFHSIAVAYIPHVVVAMIVGTATKSMKKKNSSLGDAFKIIKRNRIILKKILLLK